jgi:tetratricopeptide (TPR) repeat protein
MELVGRTAELATLDRLLDGAGAHHGTAVYLTGEPGIGKTALVGTVLRRATERGYLTLSGRAAEFERDAPFGVLVDALERHLDSFGRDRLKPLDDAQLDLLAAVFPALGLAPEQVDPHRLLRTLRALLGVLTRGRPTVLALDDLHWADPASIDLVCHLLHRGVDGPLLLVLTSRPAQSDSRLLTALQEAQRHGLGVRIPLGPLSEVDSEKLLGDRVDAARRAVLFRESGGNPFYLEQLVTGERQPTSTPALDGIPVGVAAAVRDEIDAVSPLARALLQAASVLGEPFELEPATRTAEIAHNPALEALDELLGRDLVRPAEDTRRFIFRHPIVRRAVYESAGLGWRLGAHARAAAALEMRGAPAAVRAHHVEQSASVGDEPAIEVLIQAGRETARRAPASAARWYGSALNLLKETDERRLGLLGRRALALCVAGHLEESREVYGTLLRLAPSRTDPRRLEAVVLAALLDELLGNWERAHELLREEIASLADPTSPAAAELLRELAFTSFIGADWAGVRSAATASLAADGATMAKVGALSVLALANLDDLPAAEAATAEAAALFDATTDEQVGNHQPGLAIWLGWAEVCVRRVDDAIRHLRRATALSEARGHRHLTVGLLAVTAQALAMRGRIAEMAEVVEHAVEAALLSESSLFLSWATGLKCAVEVRRGDLYAAVRFGEQAQRTGAAGGLFAESARLHLAEALLELGESQRCKDLLATAEPAFPLYGSLWTELLARAELGLGNLDRAAELVAMPGVGRARALVALERGDHALAVTEALAAASESGPVDSARARIVAGRALALADDRAAAVAELQRAHTELTDCGALRYADEAARELRKLGRAVRASTPPRPRSPASPPGSSRSSPCFPTARPTARSPTPSSSVSAPSTGTSPGSSTSSA